MNTLVCTVPPLMTTYSAAEFSMDDVATLSVSWSGSADASQVAKLNDEDFLVDYEDSTVPCYYQVSAKTGYVYQISEAKVFINTLIDKTPYDAYFHLEGSDEA